MPTVNILTVGTRGVDMRSNPLGLGNQRLHSAVNMVFDEGVVRTRPGLHYHDLGISGQFQGVSAYAPSLGISAESFGPPLSALVVAAAGRVYAIDTTGGEFGCTPVEITCEGAELRCRGEVNLYQAENYLIAQNAAAGTYWWTGDDCMVASPGLADDQYWDDPEPPKVEYIFTPPEAQNACCDTFTCYDPGGNSAPSCSGSFPRHRSAPDGDGRRRVRPNQLVFEHRRRGRRIVFEQLIEQLQQFFVFEQLQQFVVIVEQLQQFSVRVLVEQQLVNQHRRRLVVIVEQQLCVLVRDPRRNLRRHR